MASAAIAAGGSILSGILGGKGASAAAKAQAQAAQNALNLQQNEFNITQGNEQPWITAGDRALAGLEQLSGIGDDNAFLSLNGQAPVGAAQEQQNSIAALQASPLYQSIYGQGKDAVLQSAAATGGLRGGNVNTSLANFGSDLLSQTIQQQLANLSGIAGSGQSAASNLGQFGQNYANASSGLLTQQGNANATAAAAPYSAAVSTLNGLSSLLGANSGGGGIASSNGSLNLGSLGGSWSGLGF